LRLPVQRVGDGVLERERAPTEARFLEDGVEDGLEVRLVLRLVLDRRLSWRSLGFCLECAPERSRPRSIAELRGERGAGSERDREVDEIPDRAEHIESLGEELLRRLEL